MTTLRVMWLRSQTDSILHSGLGQALASWINICPIPKCLLQRWRARAARWKVSLFYAKEMNVAVYSERPLRDTKTSLSRMEVDR